jgi:hypothetical protein
MAIGGLGTGVYVAADLAQVVDMLHDQDNAAEDLGVFKSPAPFPFHHAGDSASWSYGHPVPGCP